MDYKLFLVKLADELDEEGDVQLADIIDENFDKFVKLLEEGKLDFSFLFSGTRDPRDPYSNRGRELPAYAIPGPQ